MKKIELSHDIIAEKIWERIPENDKRLQEIKRQLGQMIKNYHAGSGSLLGHQELIAWKDLLDELSKDPDAKDYIDKSKQYQDRQKWLGRVLIITYFLLCVGGAVIAIQTVQSGKIKDLLKELARRDLAEIDELILRLDYQGAWSRLQKTAELRVYADSIAMKMAESAFFYGEAGNQERAKGMLDTLAEFSNNRRMRQLLLSWSDEDSVSRWQLLRESIIALDDSITYKTLTARYYPEMVFVQGGTFTMGCTEEQGEDCYLNENPKHRVTLDDYWIAKTETTVWQWAVYLCFKEGEIEVLADLTRGNQSQMEISWIDAAKYADWLNTRNGFDTVYRSGNYLAVETWNGLDTIDAFFIDTLSNGYRLPREAEWEYAARGGRKSEGYKYAGSDSLALLGWFGGDFFSGKPYPVGQKQANELGLYDMSGNVWEWCSDWYSDYSSGVQVNPKGPGKGTYRVLRGGGWHSIALHCRVSYRGNGDPSGCSNGIGFRLARSSNQ